MSNRTVNICISISLVILGVLMIGIGLTLIPLIYKVLLGTSFVYGHFGEQPGFSSLINGLLSGGYIMILPAWKIRCIAIIGVLLVFTGAHYWVYQDMRRPLSIIFSRSYWTEFRATVKYEK